MQNFYARVFRARQSIPQKARTSFIRGSIERGEEPLGGGDTCSWRVKRATFSGSWGVQPEKGKKCGERKEEKKRPALAHLELRKRI